jgi:hypothetical protein
MNVLDREIPIETLDSPHDLDNPGGGGISGERGEMANKIEYIGV